MPEKPCAAMDERALRLLRSPPEARQSRHREHALSMMRFDECRQRRLDRPVSAANGFASVQQAADAAAYFALV